MSFYEENVVPYIVDCCCGIKALHPVRQKLVAQASGTLLEIGFGSGLNLPYLPAAVERVLAVDPSERGRRIGQERLEQARCPVDFIGLDAQVVQAESASADTALTTFTLCTIPEAAAALREVKRILKPGGKLLFLEHGRAPDPSVVRWQERLNPLQRALFGGCNLDRDVAAMVREAGFTLTTLDSGYFPRVPRTHGYLYSGVAISI
ncbi:MAG: Methyltransferase type 11 [Myxococcaceae bacterium]|nr:Methyltransferase type 11 [Myxococcaceae bacterium]